MVVEEQPRPSSSGETFHVFWPSDHPLDSAGYLVGWRVDAVYTVATLAPFSHSIGELHQSCKHSSTSLLGLLNPLNSPTSHPALVESESGWLTIMYDGRGRLQIKVRGADV